MISVSKGWGLQDCQSLAESWSMGFWAVLPKGKGQQSSQGWSPISLSPTPCLTLVLGKGHHNFRQWNFSQIKHGKKK